MTDGSGISSPFPLAATSSDPLNMNTADFSFPLSSTTTAAGLTAMPDTTPHIPQSAAAKQGKKRKSWGQELPEPTTNLPPRKRAKTDAEKEQRRIERIRRNRAAAHSSRERKRQEAERLEIDNNRLKQLIRTLQNQLATKNLTLDKCKEMLPGGLPALTQDELAKVEMPESLDTFSSESPGTFDSRVSMEPPLTEDCTSPEFGQETMSSPFQMSAPFSNNQTTFPIDLTQPPAAMLCDLQCRSVENGPSIWAQVILCLMHLNIMNLYMTLLTTLGNRWLAQGSQYLTQISFSIVSSTAIISRQALQLMPTSPLLPRSLTSTTHSSLLHSISRLPNWMALAQDLPATGPLVNGISAPKSALPFETEVVDMGFECQRTVEAAMLQVLANGYQGHLRRSGRRGDILGKSSFEQSRESRQDRLVLVS